jgi:phosphohistidine phosphatase
LLLPDPETIIFKQSAVIPYRKGKDGLQVLLITSRGGKKWVVPKGLVEPDMTPADSAGKEAMEEAGISGKIDSKSLGHYSYEKWGGICDVEVFPMLVKTIGDTWLEDFRKRKWFSIKDAIKLIPQEALIEMIRDLPRSLKKRGLLK